MPLRDTALIALCAALMHAQQIALAPLPNVELVSLLVMLYTLCFRTRVLYIISLFVLLQGLIHGFDTWWFAYLYVWFVLAGLTWLCRRAALSGGGAFVFAALSGVFGLCFGALCALVQLLIGGLYMAVSWWAQGIPFDLVHGGANFVVCLILWKPMYALLRRLTGEKAGYQTQK